MCSKELERHVLVHCVMLELIYPSFKDSNFCPVNNESGR